MQELRGRVALTALLAILLILLVFIGMVVSVWQHDAQPQYFLDASQVWSLNEPEVRP